MPTPAELQTGQAKAELYRGSGGWPNQPHPVALEPPFEPFNSNTPSVWASVYNGWRDELPPLTAAPYQDDHDDLVPIVIEQFSEDESTIPKAEQFLAALTTITRPISFEVIACGGSSDTKPFIRLQFVANSDNAPTVQRLLQAHYPNSAVQTHAGLQPSDMAMAHELYNLGFNAFTFRLSRPFLLPLITFNNLTTDPLGVLLAALDHVPTDEWAMLQILFQPTTNHWASNLQEACRNPYIKGGDYIADDITDQQFRHKFDKPLFAVVIRIAATDPDTIRLMLGWTEQFTAQPQQLTSNENEPNFNPTSSPIPHAFGTRLTYRPGIILNVAELAALVHLPAHHLASERLTRITSRTKAAPKTTNEPHAVVLGENTHRGQTTIARIPASLRTRHCYIAGASGTGKSTLILNMIKQDIEAGHGVGLLDPHGDLTDDVLALIPKHRVKDVIYFDPANKQHPPAFNILATKDASERERVVDELMTTLSRMFADSWGPRLDHYLSHALMSLVRIPRTTIGDLHRLFTDDNFVQRLVAKLDDEHLLTFWNVEYARRPKNAVDSIINKLGRFLLRDSVRNVICQRDNTFDFDEIINGKKIFLARLSAGQLSDTAAQLFGTFVVSKIVSAAFRRESIPEKQRVPFYLYIDEFQRFMNLAVSFEQILAEARKYKLVLAAMANQYVNQLDVSVRQAIFGNVGTLLTFRLGVQDAQLISQEMGDFNATELQSLNVGQAIARLGGTQSAFNLTTPNTPNIDHPSFAKQIIANSHRRNAPRQPTSPTTTQSPPSSPTASSSPASPQPTSTPTASPSPQPTEQQPASDATPPTSEPAPPESTPVASPLDTLKTGLDNPDDDFV